MLHILLMSPCHQKNVWMRQKNVHIDRYAKMRDQVMTTFKFTPRTARNTFLILGLVPFGFLYIGVVDSVEFHSLPSLLVVEHP